MECSEAETRELAEQLFKEVQKIRSTSPSGYHRRANPRTDRCSALG
jgi:hypothetical protein